MGALTRMRAADRSTTDWLDLSDLSDLSDKRGRNPRLDVAGESLQTDEWETLTRMQDDRQKNRRPTRTNTDRHGQALPEPAY